MRSLLVCVTFVTLRLLAFAGGEPVGHWDGESLIEVSINVLDADSQQGLTGAKIWLLTGRADDEYRLAAADPRGISDAYGKKIPVESLGIRALSGKEGRARLWTYFRAGGGILWENGKQREDGYWWVGGTIIVTNWDYEDFTAELKTLCANEQHPLSEANLTLSIKLTKKKAKQALAPTSVMPPSGAPATSAAQAK